MKFTVILGLCAVTAVQAQTWNNAGTDWNTGSNWDIGTVPTSSQTVTFSGTVSNQPNLSANSSAGELFFSTAGWDLTGDPGTTLSLNGVSGELMRINRSATIDAGLNLTSAGGTIEFGGALTLTINGVLSGGGGTYGVQFDGSGATLKLNGANTYTGITMISGGATNTISIGNTAAFGTSSVKFNVGIISAGTNLTGANAVMNAITSAGSLTFNNNQGYNLELGGNVIPNANGTATLIASAGTTTIDGKIIPKSTVPVFLDATGTGNFVLTGASTYTTATTIVGQTSVSTLGASGTAGNLGEGTQIKLGSTTSAGILNYTGATTSTNKTIIFSGTTGGGEIDANGTGTITFSSIALGGLDGSGSKTFTLGGASTGIISGAINNTTGGLLNVVKTGTGTWYLTSTSNNYSGTTVNAGTLNLAAGVLANTSGTLTINDGGTVISAGGASGEAIVLNTGGTLSIGATTLTIGSNSLNLAGGSLKLTLGSTFGEIAGTGALTATGGSLVLDTTGAGFNYNGTYQVLSGFGSTGLSNLSIEGYDTTDYTAHLDNTGDLSFSANELSAVPEPSTYALIFGAAALGFAVYRRRTSATAV